MACEIAKAMDVHLVAPGEDPHGVVILGGTSEQSVHDVRAELLGQDPDWRLSDEATYNDRTELPCVEAAVKLEELAKRCIRAAAERQGVAVSPNVVGMLRKDVMKTAWGIEDRGDLISKAAHACRDVVMAAAGRGWDLSLHHMEMRAWGYGCVIPSTKVLADAVQQEQAYSALSAEHEALGALWIPEVRDRVRKALGCEPSVSAYAAQVKDALGMSEAAWAGIQRVAERDLGLLFGMLGGLEVLDHGVIWGLAEAFARAHEEIGVMWYSVPGWNITEGARTMLYVLANVPEGLNGVAHRKGADRGELGAAILAAGEILAAFELAETVGPVPAGEKACFATHELPPCKNETFWHGRGQAMVDWLVDGVIRRPVELVLGLREAWAGDRYEDQPEQISAWAMQAQERWRAARGVQA
ncbi:hypothetical protein B1806_04010 [Metallibacterium scheffleri]|uniref:Uncharacterized protein n=2 Tax=Metallibacterium scheffleri TaxID=993689 RepID=A0A4V3UTN2_9GAMM|nr:hypothetical protein B1806_04010 [Metallibacterium scheffleri]